jgi:DNA-binding response OmpR family regulator
MIKLLLVEDDANLSYIIQTELEELIGGYQVTVARNGKEGLDQWESFHPDIIISDIDMPVMNGFEMVRHIRETDGDTTILFASALTSPKEVKKGFMLGVNNYVKKPFSPEEIDAHIHALLKMKSGAPIKNEEEYCKFGRYTLDAGHATLRNDETDEVRPLTARESNILEMLARNKNQVVRREIILSRFWDTEDDFFASRSLDVFITKIRKLFEDDKQIEIKTVKGVGIKLVIRTS